MAPCPRGNCLQQGMVSRWTMPEKNPPQPGPGRSMHKYTFIYALLLPDQGNGQLQEHSLQGSQIWMQNGQTQPPSLKTGELQILIQGKEGSVPFNLQLLPLHSCEGHNSDPYDKKIFKAEVIAPLQNSMFDATKFILFYTCSLSLLIFSFQDH